MLSILCNLLKTTLKVQNRIVISPGVLVADWELQTPPPRIRTKYHTCVASPRKDQNPKLKERFLLNSYHFHTIIKSKNSNLNSFKSGTGCIFVTTAQIKILMAYIFNRKDSEIYLTRPSDLASHWGPW